MDFGNIDTGRRQSQNTTKHRKLKRWATWTPQINLGWTQVLAKG